MNVPFGDLSREAAEMRPDIVAALDRILTSGRFILGREVAAFEAAFASYVGARHCVSCASGTDALTLALRALGLGPGDEVITQANTCFATVCGLISAGVRPVFCDALEDSAMIDPRSLAAAVTLRTKAIVPVNLYGASPDYDELRKFSRDHSLPLVEDCAQSHGATFDGRKTGTFGVMGCFSFYPSKNLGCYGDGGAVVTDSRECYEKLLRLRNYGQDTRYSHKEFGLNSRLDEIQAAILGAKLPRLDAWNARRNRLAALYTDLLKSAPAVSPLKVQGRVDPVYHLYVVRTPRRQKLQDHLASRGIQTFIHYPIPCHLQEACRELGYRPADFPGSEALAREVLSLPLYPQLGDEEVHHVAQTIREFDAR